MSSNPGEAQNSLTIEQIEQAFEEANTEDLIDKRPRDGVLQKHLNGKSHREQTIESKRRTWERFLDYFAESENEFLSELDANDIGEFREHLEATSDMSRYSERKHLERLKQVLDTCVNRKWVTSEIGDWEEHHPEIPPEDRQRDEDDVLVTERGNEILGWSRRKDTRNASTSCGFLSGNSGSERVRVLHWTARTSTTNMTIAGAGTHKTQSRATTSYFGIARRLVSVSKNAGTRNQRTDTCLWLPRMEGSYVNTSGRTPHQTNRTNTGTTASSNLFTPPDSEGLVFTVQCAT